MPADPADLRSFLDDVESWCREWDAEYVFGRVPPDRNARRMLEGAGYGLVETSLTLGSGPHTDLPRVAASLVPEFVVPDDDQLREAVAIARDDFNHGRFLEDPEIDEGAARARTGHWLTDLAAAGAARVVVHRGRTIGFFCDSVDEARLSAELVLAGVRAGSELLALPTWVAALSHLRERGVRRTTTMVSASNVGVMNLYAALGFRVEAVHLGYRKFLS